MNIFFEVLAWMQQWSVWLTKQTRNSNKTLNCKSNNDRWIGADDQLSALNPCHH